MTITKLVMSISGLAHNNLTITHVTSQSMGLHGFALASSLPQLEIPEDTKIMTWDRYATIDVYHLLLIPHRSTYRTHC